MFNPMMLQLLNPTMDKNAIFDNLMKTNPQFAKFVEDNKGKTPEQIAKENNIDMSIVRRLI